MKRTMIGVGIAALAAILLYYTLGRDRQTPATDGRQAAVSPGASGAIQVRGKRAAVPPPPAPRPLRLSRAEVAASDAAHGAFEGTVIDWGNGRPIPGAELSFHGDQGMEAVRADASGTFHFEPSDGGVYRLALVTREGFLPFAPALGESPIEARGRPRQLVRGLTIYLSPAIDYRGLVVDDQGSPVPGATIRLLGADSGERSLMPIRSSYESDDKGRFVFNAPDHAVLEASAAGGLRGSGVVDDNVQISHELKLQLTAVDGGEPSASKISGRVVSSDGQPIPDASVRIAGGGFLRSAVARTGDEGDFEIEVEEGRRATLWVQAAGYASGGGLATAGDSNVTIELGAGQTISGKVTDSSGTPVASFHIAVFAVANAMEKRLVKHTSVLSASGEFEIRDLRPGDYEVQAMAHGMARSRPVAASAGDDEVRITLEPGAVLVGTVVDADSDKGLPRAKVTVETMLGAGAGALPLSATAITDETGSFELSGLGPGRVSVVVAAYQHNRRIVSGLDAVPGAKLGPMTIELSPVKDGEAPVTEITGIGAVISRVEGDLTIRKVLPGGGAADAKLEAGDVITAVNKKQVVDLGFESALQLIRGPVGTTVALTMKRPGGDEVVQVTRKKLRF